MKRQFRGSLPRWLACFTVALSACGAESSFDDAQELVSVEQQTDMGNLGQDLTSVAGTMLFGGMYGYGGDGYINTYTGGYSCPSGYYAYQVLGSSGMDWPLYFCGRFPEAGIEPVAEFGGGYGPHTDVNKITGGMSCPSGYLTTKTLGATGTDWTLYYCHRPYTPGVPGRYLFGGMYGYRDGPAYPNPMTGTTSCPAGFTANRVLGTYGVDYEVWMCYRNL